MPTTTPTPRRPFQWRAMTSVLIALAFVALTVTGALLFVSPPGRVANWTDWRLVGLTKHQWTALHVTFSSLFLVVALGHLLFNYRPLMGYFRDRMTRRASFRLEWAAAAGIAVLVFFGTQHQWPPFAQLLAFNEDVKKSWEEPATRAPVPHAELLTLEELASQAKIEPATASQRLEAAGAKQFSLTTRVDQIAAGMGLPAVKVFEIITGPARGGGGRGHGATGGSGPGGGGGPGWKTLEQYCTEEGIPLATAQERLQARNLKAEPGQTLREIAVNNGFDRPFGLIEVLRGTNAPGHGPGRAGPL